MKRILLTTTSLVLAAGVAQADVSFSGKGEVGVSKTATKTEMAVHTGYDLNVAVSGSSDNGVTYAIGFDFGGGSLTDYNDDYELDPQNNASDGNPAVTIGYAGATFVFDKDGVDDLYDDGNHGDVSVSATLGGLSFAVVAETDSGEQLVTDADSVDRSSNSTSFSVSGASDALTWSVVSTDADPTDEAAQKVTVGYTLSDALGLTFKHDTKGAADSINTVTATYTMGALTLTAAADDNNDNDLTVAYTAGALSASATVNEASFWKMNGTYDLGNGAQAFVSMDDSEWTAIGMSFAF